MFREQAIRRLPADVLDPIGRLLDGGLQRLVDDRHVPAHVDALALSREVDVHLELRGQHDRSLTAAIKRHELLDARHTDVTQPDRDVRLRGLHVR